MQYVLPIAAPILSFILGLISAKYQKLKNVEKQTLDKEQAMYDGMRSLLRDLITDVYYESKEKGYCRLYKRDNLEDAYKHYKALGGNGVITDLHDKIIQLPTDPPKERTN